jgi:hypothetical protein
MDWAVEALGRARRAKLPQRGSDAALIITVFLFFRDFAAGGGRKTPPVHYKVVITLRASAALPECKKDGHPYRSGPKGVKEGHGIKSAGLAKRLYAGGRPCARQARAGMHAHRCRGAPRCGARKGDPEAPPTREAEPRTPTAPANPGGRPVYPKKRSSFIERHDGSWEQQPLAGPLSGAP